jgi:hypothetical protein
MRFPGDVGALVAVLRNARLGLNNVRQWFIVGRIAAMPNRSIAIRNDGGALSCGVSVAVTSCHRCGEGNALGSEC